MNREVRDAFAVHRKITILEYAQAIGNVYKTCREFKVARSSFYRWKKAYAEEGKAGLARKKPIAKSHPNQVPAEFVEKILHLRTAYHLGPQRIAWYLERYHGFKTSCSSVSRNTAIDDATRIRALRIYQKHNQKSSINFIDYVIETFPFRIHTIRTDRGHEWQAQFHWHVEDKGIRHVYIKPRSPQLNGKVERSHRSDKEEFYQLLTYKDDVDLNKKLATWEEFYNRNRPHGAHNGKTPYEALRSMLK